MNRHAFLRLKFTPKAATRSSANARILIAGPATDANRKGTRPLFI